MNAGGIKCKPVARTPAICAAVFAACSAAGAATDDAVRELPGVTIVSVAHRSGRPLDDAAPTVSVITRRDLEENLAFNLRDMLRYEPGVSIDNNPARFGLGNLNIRGIEGNRVLLLLDGIRLADAYRVGSFSNAGRDTVGLGLLQKVEILRGPGSALYGSDALAGVLSFTTVDPRDIVSRPAGRGVTVDAGAASADGSVLRGLVVATRDPAFETLVGYQRSDGEERTNQGGNAVVGTTRTAPNPQHRVAESWLAKLLLPTNVALFKLTLDRLERGTATGVLSLNPQSSRTVALTGNDRTLRERASFDVDADGAGPFDRVRALVYAMRSLTVNDTLDLRANTTATCLSAVGTINCLRAARFRLAQREDGASLLADLNAAGRWVIGAEIARIEADEKRDGEQTILNTGAVSKTVGSETFPTRDFPFSRTERVGLFAQNEIDLPAAALSLIPALRYDRFRIEPQVDPVFAAGNPGRPVVALSDDAFSPKLGALWRPIAGTTFSALAASGFRAPPAADINIGLANLPSGTVIPNPDLKSERSHGLELGARTRLGAHQFTATVFQTRYRDLIVARAALACPSDPRCVPGTTATFQSQNITRARISGVEATALVRLAPFWLARGAFAAARGGDRDKHQPLNSIEPPRLTLGLLRESARLNLGAHVTHARRKTNVDQTTGPYFEAPAFTTLDLTASWIASKQVKLSFGLFNVFDRKYWLWSDLRSAPNPGLTVDRYTQPGRNASVLVRVTL